MRLSQITEYCDKITNEIMKSYHKDESHIFMSKVWQKVRETLQTGLTDGFFEDYKIK